MPPPQVTVVEVKPQTVPLTYEYAARISAYRQVDVRARVGGILLKRNFVEGAEVKAGDVLFLIDPAPYEAALAQAQAQLQQAQAQLTQAQREEKRNINLFDQNAVTQKARDDATSTRQLAEAAVAAAQAQVQTAQLNLDYTKVTAPVGGITSLEQVSEGSLIGTTGDTGLLTSITQLDPVYVNFSFSDTEAAEVRRLIDLKKAKGQAPNLGVKISFGDGTTYDHDGVVDFTSSTIDVSTGTLQARAVVDNPIRRLLPGQFVRATVTGVSLDNAITIPEVALMQSPQGQFVYTIDKDGKARVNPVTLGQKVGSNWLVLSGLSAGDKLITEGIIKVRPGSPVQAAEAATPADANKVAQN
ncbi:efflux RND transporter periplasmic adaptor subunit [Rhizobium sp. BK313]|uniref:efflux RND transporter periplasmic adaptor subunit n=1 Tax=Rhizobium sp. BK313 TaxID=2587081 RepID=UPI001FEDFE51|nr:efflux RND transporter periplasmic adaptor subunit [Rhizobium sp. BK313]